MHNIGICHSELGKTKKRRMFILLLMMLMNRLDCLVGADWEDLKIIHMQWGHVTPSALLPLRLCNVSRQMHRVKRRVY